MRMRYYSIICSYHDYLFSGTLWDISIIWTTYSLTSSWNSMLYSKDSNFCFLNEIYGVDMKLIWNKDFLKDLGKIQWSGNMSITARMTATAFSLFSVLSCRIPKKRIQYGKWEGGVVVTAVKFWKGKMIQYIFILPPLYCIFFQILLFHLITWIFITP